VNLKILITTSFVLAASLAFSACHGGPKIEGIPATPLGLKPPAPKAAPAPLATIATESGPTLQPLTSIGTNSEARFSPDGTHLIFVSQGRPSHKNAQIYTYDLKTRLERRLSFHAGDDREPSYSPDGQEILYSSNTDEVKEEPAAIDHLMRSYFPEGRKDKARDPYGDASDLYLQTPNGRTVERLTRAAGYDGDGDFDSHEGHRVVYISTKDGESNLSILELHGHSLKKLSEGKGLKRSPRFSPDGAFLVWAQKNLAAAPGGSPGLVGAAETTPETPFKIMITEKDFKNPHLMIPSAPGDTQMDPFWLPKGDGIIFSSNRGGRFFNLFFSDRDGKCVRRLSKADFDEVQPAVSPDGKHVVFTSHKDGLSQIYMMDYPAMGDCLAQVTPAPSPTVAPTATPAPKPTAVPTPKPTPTPAAKLAATPTPKPVTPKPSATPVVAAPAQVNSATPAAIETPAASATPEPNPKPKFRRKPRATLTPAATVTPAVTAPSAQAEPSATPAGKPANGPGL
jgi:Tol biopolymer transport system component